MAIQTRRRRPASLRPTTGTSAVGPPSAAPSTGVPAPDVGPPLGLVDLVEPTEPLVEDVLEPDHVPRSHRPDGQRSVPPRVESGRFSPMAIIVGPTAFVFAMLAVPSTSARGVVLLVGWLVIAVSIEVRDTRRRHTRRARPPAVDVDGHRPQTLEEPLR